MIRRRLRTTVVALVVGGSLALSGCGSASDLDDRSAQELQAGVLSVTQAVAAHRYDAAEAAVEKVREHLEAAVDDGNVSASRYRLIDDALDEVYDEIVAARQAAVLAEQAAAEQAAAEQAAAEQVAAEQVAAEQAAALAAEQAAAEQAAAAAAAAQQSSGGGGGEPAAPAKDPSKGNNGKGNGNGNSKG